MYDPTEPIPHKDSALAPAKCLVITRPPQPLTPEPVKVVVKGSHPRRTYVGIKARRKRLNGPADDDDNDNENDSYNGDPGAESDMEGGLKSPRVNPNTSNNSSGASNFVPNKIPRTVKSALMPQDPNWRENVYYLVGGLFINNSSAGRPGTAKISGNVHVCLKGKWLSSLNGKPSREDISAWSNKNEFYYESLAQEDLSTLSPPDSDKLKPLSGNYTGFHFISQPQPPSTASASSPAVIVPPTKCTETLLQLLFTTDTDDSPNGSTNSTATINSDTNYNIVGKGDSDLGKFILFGKYNAQTRELEVSRQFVRDTDPCNGFSLQYLQENHKLGLSRQAGLGGQQQQQPQQPQQQLQPQQPQPQQPQQQQQP